MVKLQNWIKVWFSKTLEVKTRNAQSPFYPRNNYSLKYLDIPECMLMGKIICMDPPDFHPLSKYYHHISSYNAQIIKSYSIGSITIFIIQSRLTFIALTFVQLKTVSLVHQISSYPISKRSLQEKTSTRRWIKFFVKPKTSHGKIAFIRSTGQFVLLVSGNF